MMRGLLLLILVSLSSAPQASFFEMPKVGNSVVGQPYYIKARHEDTFVDIALKNDVGFDELKLANPKVDAWIPGENTRVLIPTYYVLPQVKHEGLVLNLAEKRMYYFPKARVGHRPRVFTYPVSIGRQDWHTPLGSTKIVRKKKDPNWYPPESIRKEHEEKGDPLPKVVKAGPDNPLGNRAMYLGIQGYLIHGTNKPNGIGLRVSHGCIRMLPRSIEELFDLVDVKTPVLLVDEPFKFGILNGEILFEAHQPANTEMSLHNNRGELTRLLHEATNGSYDYEVDWDLIDVAIKNPRGIPIPVGTMQVQVVPLR